MKVIRDTREVVLISGIPQITCNQIVCNSAMKKKPLNSQVSVEHNYVPTVLGLNSFKHVETCFRVQNGASLDKCSMYMHLKRMYILSLSGMFYKCQLSSVVLFNSSVYLLSTFCLHF